MNEQEKDGRDGILTLLDDVADHHQTPEEAQAELTGDGVNVSAFLARVQQAVDRQRKEERLAWRRVAQRNVEAFSRSEVVASRFATMSRAELEAMAQKYSSEVHFKNLEKQTDEDLRTLLADKARLEELGKT